MYKGENIRKIRELIGYSQEYVATQLGISQAAYSKLERSQNLNIKRIEKLSKILGVTPQQILDFNEEILFNPVQIKKSPAIIKAPYSFELERKLYQKQIDFLEKEIEFLRNQLDKLIANSKF